MVDRSRRRYRAIGRRAVVSTFAGFDPSTLLAHYGYRAVAIGALLEGETFLVMAGFAAHRGLLNFKAVVAVAFVCSMLGDQFYFWLGRRHGASIVRRFPGLARKEPKIRTLLDRWGVVLILAIRFLIGARTAGPFVMGWTGVNPVLFAVCNAIGAALWALLIAGIGYLVANTLDTVLQDFQRFEDAVLLGLLSAGILAWIWHALRARRKPSA